MLVKQDCPRCVTVIAGECPAQILALCHWILGYRKKKRRGSLEGSDPADF